MEYYHLNRDYKMLLDRIQVHYRCCGPDSYLEWYKVNWFREEYITEELNNSVRERCHSIVRRLVTMVIMVAMVTTVAVVTMAV